MWGTHCIMFCWFWTLWFAWAPRFGTTCSSILQQIKSTPNPHNIFLLFRYSFLPPAFRHESFPYAKHMFCCVQLRAVPTVIYTSWPLISKSQSFLLLLITNLLGKYSALWYPLYSSHSWPVLPNASSTFKWVVGDWIMPYAQSALSVFSPFLFVGGSGCWTCPKSCACHGWSCSRKKQAKTFWLWSVW